MKKLGIFIVLALAGAGFLYWFMHPKQQLKRKTTRILNSITVEPGQSGGSSDAFFADSLFEENVNFTFNDKSKKSSIIQTFLQRSSLSRDYIMTGIQRRVSYFQELTHNTSDFESTKVDDSNYKVAFKNTLVVHPKKGFAKSTYNLIMTFNYKKSSEGWRLSEVDFAEQ